MNNRDHSRYYSEESQSEDYKGMFEVPPEPNPELDLEPLWEIARIGTWEEATVWAQAHGNWMWQQQVFEIGLDSNNPDISQIVFNTVQKVGVFIACRFRLERADGSAFDLANLALLKFQYPSHREGAYRAAVYTSFAEAALLSEDRLFIQNFFLRFPMGTFLLDRDVSESYALNWIESLEFRGVPTHRFDPNIARELETRRVLRERRSPEIIWI